VVVQVSKELDFLRVVDGQPGASLAASTSADNPSPRKSFREIEAKGFSTSQISQGLGSAIIVGLALEIGLQLKIIVVPAHHQMLVWKTRQPRLSGGVSTSSLPWYSYLEHWRLLRLWRWDSCICVLRCSTRYDLIMDIGVIWIWSKASMNVM
jgi:hypothetical protein